MVPAYGYGSLQEYYEGDTAKIKVRGEDLQADNYRPILPLFLIGGAPLTPSHSLMPVTVPPPSQDVASPLLCITCRQDPMVDPSLLAIPIEAAQVSGRGGEGEGDKGPPGLG